MQPALIWDDRRFPHFAVMGRLRERAGLLADELEVHSTAVVLIFTHPDSPVAEQLIRRRTYFDRRTGKNWDLFFPGYYRHGSTRDPQALRLDDSWGFSPRSFDDFRRDLEARTDGRWRFSGESELVVLNAYLALPEPMVDFESVQSGPLTDTRSGSTTLTLAQVVERVSQGFEDETEDPTYGVETVVAPSSVKTDSVAGKVAIGATGGVIASVLRQLLHLS